MSGFVENLLNVAPVWVFLTVALLVFAEDAIFVGFVIPGETAALIGGVDASRGHVSVVAMCCVVVGAAILGDSVGYEVGKKFGPRLLRITVLATRQQQLDGARSFLARRGGAAVFLGRFFAFFRAVMPALAGISRMPYRRFLPYNAVGGLLWGTGFVLIGFFAGNSYQAVAGKVGVWAAVAVAVAVVAGLVVWRWREHRSRSTVA